MITLEHKDVWNFRYLHVNAEIVHWCKGKEFCPNGIWNFYLYLPFQMFAEEQAKQLIAEVRQNAILPIRKYFDYSKIPINSLDWHGGITYYDLLRDEDGTPTIIKVGCDYNHLYDHDMVYDENFIAMDAREIINELWEMYPDMKVWRQSDGKYVAVSELGG